MAQTAPGAPQNNPKSSPSISTKRPKEYKNESRRAQEYHKQPQERPKTTPRTAQECQKSEPEQQDEKRTEPRRSQDRLGPPRGRLAQLSGVPRVPFGRRNRHQNGAEIDPTSRRKIKRKNNDPRRSWTRLGAIFGRFGAPSWATKQLKPCILNGFVKKHFFENKTVQRRFQDQLGPNKTPT